MIATGVVTPFLIPVKVALMAAFLAVLAVRCSRRGRSSPPDCTPTKKTAGGSRARLREHDTLRCRARVLYFRVRRGVRFVYKIAPKAFRCATDIRNYSISP